MSLKHFYCFTDYVSFPSSAVAQNLTGTSKGDAGHILSLWKTVLVKPSSTIRVEVMVKTKNVSPNEPSWVSFIGFDNSGKVISTEYTWTGYFSGDIEWSFKSFGRKLSAKVASIQVRFVAGGSGAPNVAAETWFDDLKIYQDGILIYSNDFSNWDPIIGAGIGAPIGGVAGYLLKEPLGPMVSEVVGAVVGGALGGGVGLLTGLGIIPVPQIPALGAAPEGPGAPARLGKYQITG